MKKETTSWTVTTLKEQFQRLNFPEYQREPNVWSRDAKQRLIDSMLREFDIASLYLYVNGNDSIDCVDGRQRVGAIMSFLGDNPKDEDNGFEFRILNEIYQDEGHPQAAFDKMGFEDIAEIAENGGEGQEEAKGFVDAVMNYALTMVKLSDSREAREFNLQFARLNLGTIINSGEKLHAMVGELRDVCFDDVGKHAFLESTNVPTRRYSREQLAAQILLQVFTIEQFREEEEPCEYARTRHFDLQRFFKECTALDQSQRTWVERTRVVLDLLGVAFNGFEGLKSRALVLSTVLLAYEREITTSEEAETVAGFIRAFLARLKWQVGKGLDGDEEYRHLFDFQRHVTQASVEKPAVRARAEMLHREFEVWQQQGRLSGDEEYLGRNPGSNLGE